MFINSFKPLDNHSMWTTGCLIGLQREDMSFLGLCLLCSCLPQVSADLYVQGRRLYKGSKREALRQLWEPSQLMGLVWVSVPVGLSWEIYLPPGLTTEFLHFYLHRFLASLTFSTSKASYLIPLLFLDLCFMGQLGWGYPHSFFFPSYALLLFWQGGACP